METCAQDIGVIVCYFPTEVKFKMSNFFIHNDSVCRYLKRRITANNSLRN